ncbi:hypothetical protein [Sporosarcina sp. BP05]|uniref:hypothetical protein n=1 Tax=Sporosarcina sp. BP05 TaxID=2758726 RepID=UPI00164808E3|nr:hypothetical protein [Sporosarcina sp. BP05]
MNCSYCQTENQNNIDKCTFCNAPFTISRPKQKDFLALELAEKTFEELIQFHTYDLLVLLRLVRAERSTAYDIMISIQRLLKKAPEGSQDDSGNAELVKHTEADYRRYTSRMKVLEGILIDRMGYKPKRVDNKLLEALQTKIQRN